MTLIEKHPQSAEIISQLIAGVPLRQIATNAKPPMHYATLSRFKVNMLSAATRNMRGRSIQTSAIKELANQDSMGVQKDRVRYQLEQELQHRSNARARREADAESSQTVDPETGEVRHNMDHGALGRYDANGLREIELRARLAGLLQDETQNTVMVAFMSVGDATPKPAIAPCEVIEASFTRK